MSTYLAAHLAHFPDCLTMAKQLHLSAIYHNSAIISNLLSDDNQGSIVWLVSVIFWDDVLTMKSFCVCKTACCDQIVLRDH